LKFNIPSDDERKLDFGPIRTGPWSSRDKKVGMYDLERKNRSRSVTLLKWGVCPPFQPFPTERFIKNWIGKILAFRKKFMSQ
jgi:hypothetical protein